MPLPKISLNSYPTLWFFLVATTAGLIILISGEKSTLTCNRRSNDIAKCELKDFSLFSTKRSMVIPLKDIKKVDIIANSDDEDASALLVLVINDRETVIGKSDSYLATNDEQIAIGVSGNYDEKDKIATQIAWFIENQTATTFNLTDGNQTLAWCSLLILLFQLLICFYIIIIAIRKST